MKDSYDYICDGSNFDEIISHMLEVLSDDRYNSSTAWLMEAISQVREELELLLRPVSGYTFTPELAEPCSVIAAIRHIRKKGNTINPARPIGNTDTLVEEFEESLLLSRKARRRIGFLSQNYEDLLLNIDSFLNFNPTDKQCLDELIDEIRVVRRSLLDNEQKDSVRSFRRKLDDLSDAIGDLSRSGIDMLAFRAVEQYQALTKAEEGSWKSFYFSATMRTLDVFKNLRKNPWFVSPDALYIHPHMKMVKLTQPNPLGGDRQKLNLTRRLITNSSFRGFAQFPTRNVDKKNASIDIQSISGGNFCSRGAYS